MTAGKGISRANANRQVRQEALREQLSNQGHVQHVVENINKLSDLDKNLDAIQVQRLRAANEASLKLVNKYLPDCKTLEIIVDDNDKHLTPWGDVEAQVDEQRPDVH